MAYEILANKKNYLWTNSTDSPSLFHDLNAYHIGIWFYYGGTAPSSNLYLLDWRDLSGANSDTARYSFYINTSGEIAITGVADDGTTDTKTETLTTGWHLVMSRRNSGSSGCYLDGSSGFGSLASGELPDVALDTLWIGREVNGTASNIDTKIGGLFIRNAQLNNSQMDAAYADAERLVTASNLRCRVGFENSLEAATGTVKLHSQNLPTFVNDTDVFTGDTWTANEISQIPVVTNGHLVPKNGDFHFGHFGDSFAFLRDDRLPFHLMNEYARAAEVDLIEVQLGVNQATNNANLIQAADETGTGGVSYALSSGGGVGGNNDGYRIARDETGSAVYLALPVEVVREFDASGASTGKAFTTFKAMNAAGSESGPATEWIPNDTTPFEVTVLVTPPPYNPLDEVSLADSGSNAVTRDGISGLTTARIHSLDSIEVSDNSTAGERWCNVDATSNHPTTGVLDLVGVKFTNTSKSTGMSFSCGAGSSWTIDSYGRNESATGTSTKKFLITELQGWLESISQSGKKIVLAFHLNQEDQTQEDYETDYEAIVTLFTTLFSNLSVTNYALMFITHPIHQAASTQYDDRIDAENMVLAARTVALANPTKVVHADLYTRTEGNYFHDNADAVLGTNDANSPQEQFVSTYNTETGSSMDRTTLDTSNLHLDARNDAYELGKMLATNIYAVASNDSQNLLGKSCGRSLSRSIGHATSQI